MLTISSLASYYNTQGALCPDSKITMPFSFQKHHFLGITTWESQDPDGAPQILPRFLAFFMKLGVSTSLKEYRLHPADARRPFTQSLIPGDWLLVLSCSPSETPLMSIKPLYLCELPTTSPFPKIPKHGHHLFHSCPFICIQGRLYLSLTNLTQILPTP